MYNALIKKFPDGSSQVRTYSTPVLCKADVDFERDEPDPLGVPALVPAKKPYTLKELREMERKSLRSSAVRSKQTVYDLCRANQSDFQFFVTLTFNPERVNSFDYGVVCRKVSNYLDRVRRKCPDMKYIGVPERHKSGRYHFHFLMGNCDELGFVDSGCKTKGGEVIYNVGSYRLGFSTATEIIFHRKSSMYLTKYLTKDLISHIRNKKRYWHSNNLVMPEVRKLLLDLSEYTFEVDCDYHKHIKISDENCMDIYEFHAKA